MGLAIRIIPVLLFDEHGCVKGQRFNPGRRIGSIHDRLRLIERRDVDELVLLDVSATPNNRGPRLEEIAQLCENLFCPVTVGGGIRSVADMARLIRDRADKCAIQTAILDRPSLIDEAAGKFGAQAVVAAIDVNQEKEVVAACGNRATGRRPVDWAKECEDRGAGEILLTSIDRDGTQQGYDLDLISAVSQAVTIPVVAAGGCGSYEDMAKALKAGAHAVASGAFFQFCDATPKGASRYLNEQGFVTRI